MKRWSKKSRKELSSLAQAARTARGLSALLVLAFCTTGAATPILFKSVFAASLRTERLDKARRQRERLPRSGGDPQPTLHDAITPVVRPVWSAKPKRVRPTKDSRRRAAKIRRVARPLVPVPTPVVTFKDDMKMPVFGKHVATLGARRTLAAKERRFLRGACAFYGLRPDAPWFRKAKIEFQFARECYVVTFTAKDGTTRTATASVVRRDWRGALTTIAASMQRARTSIELPVLKRHG